MMYIQREGEKESTKGKGGKQRKKDKTPLELSTTRVRGDRYRIVMGIVNNDKLEKGGRQWRVKKRL